MPSDSTAKKNSKFEDQCLHILQKLGIEIRTKEERNGLLIFAGRKGEKDWFVLASPTMKRANARINDLLRGYAAIGYQVALLSPSFTSIGKGIQGALLITGRKFHAELKERDTAEDAYGVALRYIAEGKYEDAVALLTGVVQYQGHEPLLSLGLAYYRLGLYRDALEAYRRADARQRTRASLAGMASSYSRLAEWDEALRCYEELLGMEPEDEEALRESSKLLLLKGNCSEALKQAEKLVSVTGSDEDRALAAIARLKLGEEDKALEILRKLYTLPLEQKETHDSHTAPLMSNSATLLLEKISSSGMLKDDEDAQKLFRLLINLERTDAAEAAAYLAERKESGSQIVMEEKERLSYIRGQFSESELLGRLLLARKFEPEYRRRIASSLFRERKTREAIEFLHGMDDPVTTSFIIAARLVLGEDRLPSTLKGHRFADIRNNILFAELKRDGEGSEKFAGIDHLPAAVNNMGVALFLEGREEEARTALGSLKNSRTAMANLGIIMLHSRKYKEAASLLSTALQTSGRASAFESLGEAYYALHDFDRARESFTHAIELDPTMRRAKRNLKRLSKITA